jgi:hypothetical protein
MCINVDKFYTIKFCIILCIFFLSAISFITIGVPYINSNSYKENICFIDRIDYPTNIPTLENHNNWIQCDCGQRCISWIPCIKLYSNISSEFIRQNYYYPNSLCSFSNNCIYEETPQTINTYLNNSLKMYDQYINKNISCFYDENDITHNKNIFLEKEFSIFIILLITVPFALIILYGIIVSIKSNYMTKSVNLIHYEDPLEIYE